MSHTDIIGIAIILAGTCVVAVCAISRLYTASSALEVMDRIHDHLQELVRLERQRALRDRMQGYTPPTRRNVAVR
jgi:hypothetical protein